jgi:hypothetical protein
MWRIGGFVLGLMASPCFFLFRFRFLSSSPHGGGSARPTCGVRNGAPRTRGDAAGCELSRGLAGPQRNRTVFETVMKLNH